MVMVSLLSSSEYRTTRSPPRQFNTLVDVNNRNKGHPMPLPYIKKNNNNKTPCLYPFHFVCLYLIPYHSHTGQTG